MPSPLIAGIDEAGRGSAIGPLVVAGVSIEETNLPKLTELGVKDSKLLSAEKREKLAPEIKRIVQNFGVIKLQPDEIDRVVRSGRKLHKLNRIEAKAMAQIIVVLNPKRVYVDAADVLEWRFKHHILENLTRRTEIVSEHKADRNYAVVSAASIIAKVERDREILELTKVWGDLGSGYPSDVRTVAFLEKSINQLGQYPAFVRKSWAPARKAKSEKGSRQLTLI